MGTQDIRMRKQQGWKKAAQVKDEGWKGERKKTKIRKNREIKVHNTKYRRIRAEETLEYLRK